MTKSEQKYRPVLTAEQITYLLALCKQSTELNSICINCIHTLSIYQTKIDNLGITPAYTTNPRQSVLEKLGENPVPERIGNNLLTKEETWEQSYKLYLESPTLCSLRQIRESQEHMYLNDLMSAEEIATFEAIILEEEESNG